MEKAFKWSDGPTGMTSGEYADYLDKLAEFKPLPLDAPAELEAHLKKYGALVTTLECATQEETWSRDILFRPWLPSALRLLEQHAPNLHAIKLWVGETTPAAHFSAVAVAIPASITAIEIECKVGRYCHGAAIGPFFDNLPKKASQGLKRVLLRNLQVYDSIPSLDLPALDTLIIKDDHQSGVVENIAIGLRGMPALRHVHLAIEWASMQEVRETLLTLRSAVETVYCSLVLNGVHFGDSGGEIPLLPRDGVAMALPKLKRFTVEMMLAESTSEDITLFGKHLSFFSQLPVDTFVFVSERNREIGDLTCLRIVLAGGGDPVVTYNWAKVVTSSCAARCAQLGIKLDVAVLLCNGLWDSQGAGVYRGEGEMEA